MDFNRNLAQQCGDCIFWQPIRSEEMNGVCRRYPPTVQIAKAKYPKTEFRYLTVYENSVACGEYKEI